MPRRDRTARKTRQFRQHPDRRRRQRHRARIRLAVGKPELACFQVHVLPMQGQDLALAEARSPPLHGPIPCRSPRPYRVSPRGGGTSCRLGIARAAAPVAGRCPSRSRCRPGPFPRTPLSRTCARAAPPPGSPRGGRRSVGHETPAAGCIPTGLRVFRGAPCPRQGMSRAILTPGRSGRGQDEERVVGTFETGPGKVSGPIIGILGLHEGNGRNFMPGSPSGRTRNDLWRHWTPERPVSHRRGERWTGRASSARPSCHGIPAHGGRGPGWGPRPREASPGRRRSRSSGSCLPGMPWCR